MRLRGSNWTKDEDAVLIQMTQDGFSSFAIARKLGRSKQATESRRSLLRQRGFDAPRGKRPRKAEQSPATDAKTTACKKRNCLCCGGEFISAGPHNRLCKRCRQKSFGIFDRPAALAQ